MGIVKFSGFRSALEYVVVDCRHDGRGRGKRRVNWVLVLESCSSRSVEWYLFLSSSPPPE